MKIAGRIPPDGEREVCDVVRNLTLLKSPWRAILRARVDGEVRILLPRVCLLPKLRQDESIRVEVNDAERR